MPGTGATRWPREPRETGARKLRSAAPDRYAGAECRAEIEAAERESATTAAAAAADCDIAQPT